MNHFWKVKYLPCENLANPEKFILFRNNCSLICLLPSSDVQVAAKGFLLDPSVRLLLTFSCCDFAESHSEHYKQNCYAKAALTAHSRFNGPFTSAPQGKNRAWKHKTRQSIKCNYLSSVGIGDQVAVILSLISSETTVMQFGVTAEPWEWATDLTASNASHLSISSSHNLITDVFHRPAALATWIVTDQFLKMVKILFCKLLPLWLDDHSSLPVYTFNLPSGFQHNKVL